MKSKDKFGVTWTLPKEELCPTCGQPDSCGDCNHKQLTSSEVKILGGKLAKK
jgi:hypothetical protein